LLVTAVVALSISTVLISRERQRKEEQHRLALTNLRHAQEADEMLIEVGGVDLAEVPRMESVRRKLLEKARAGYQTFLAQRLDDPAIRFGAGRVQGRLGDVLEMLGDYPHADQ